MSYEKGLIVDWDGLKKMGWPYSKATTWRKMKPEILRTKGSRRKGTYREWVEPNPDIFPQCRKLGPFRNSHPVWMLEDVLSYFETNGLAVKRGRQAL